MKTSIFFFTLNYRIKTLKEVFEVATFEMQDFSVWEKLKFLIDSYKKIKNDYFPSCTKTFHDTPELMKIIQDRPRFDAIVTQWSCGSVLSHVLDAPLIWFTPANPEGFDHQMKSLGNTMNPSIQPRVETSFVEPMTFVERLQNIVGHKFTQLLRQFLETGPIDHFRKEIYPDLPDFGNFTDQRSVLLISNSHVATHGSWPYYENILNLGGLHLKPGKELEGDLKYFMDSHPEGVAYVSFGSHFKASNMNPNQKAMFHEAFEELKIPIIWKWDDDISGISNNVFVSKWVPQNDLLSHPNLKVFVTHGGLLSVQEAIYHKTTLVGVPLAHDHKGNIARAVSNGYAIGLELISLSKEKLVSAIRQAWSNEPMRRNIGKANQLFMTRENPLNRGVDAIERVMRDSTYCKIKPGRLKDITWYQYFGIDVALFIFIMTLFLCLIVFKLLLICCRRFSSFRKSKIE